jgi:hypothetical protein
MNSWKRSTLAASALLLAAISACGQATPLPNGDVNKLYEKLLKQIDQIPIYDNHSHATFPTIPIWMPPARAAHETSVLRLRDVILNCGRGEGALQLSL